MDAYGHRLAIAQRFGQRIAAGDAVFLTGSGAIAGLPCTESQGGQRTFSGVNLFMLLQVMKDKSWSDPRFYTAAQINQSGWSLRSTAKPIGLQFLVATGEDGVRNNEPQTKRFSVFNVADIDGPGPAVQSQQPILADAQAAAREAGFPSIASRVARSVDQWLSSSQVLTPYRSVAGASELRVCLACTLLQAQTGVHGIQDNYAPLSDAWLKAIQKEPLSFFYAVKDAEVMAADAMRQVHAMRIQREAHPTFAGEHIDGKQAPRGKDVKDSMAGNAKASQRVEALFENRVAVLAVPYADKDRAQSLGAVWYAPRSLWFVPEGVDPTRFKEWSLGSTHCLGTPAYFAKIEVAFSAALKGMGFDISKTDITDDEKWRNVRVSSLAKPNKSGSFVLRLKGANGPNGVIVNHHTGETVHWTYDGPALTPEQQAQMLAKAKAREAEALADQKLTQDVAAVHASEIWAQGRPAHDHGYVIKKDISSEGLRQVSGGVLLQYDEFRGASGKSVIRADELYLVVPMCDRAGNLRALQAIDSEGAVKSFMRGAQKKGTMLVLGAPSFDALCEQSDVRYLAYTEGIATGASYRDAVPVPVVVCFDAGNLEAVAQDTIPTLPSTKHAVLAVDNDQFHVERAIGFLARELGVNPFGHAGGHVVVWDGERERPVALGDSLGSGEWQQTAKGRYCMSLEQETGGDAVRSVTVEMVLADGGRKITSTFNNRGVEAGRKVLDSLGSRAVQAQVAIAVPVFQSLDSKPTDWNDLVVREGGASARAVLAGQGLSLMGSRQPMGHGVGTSTDARKSVAMSR